MTAPSSKLAPGLPHRLAPHLARHLLRARVRAGSLLTDNAFRGFCALVNLHPRAFRLRRGLDVVRDVAYLPGGERGHLLDVVRPKDRSGPLPVVLYVHGGGFRMLSKDTHWMIAGAIAMQGYVVVNVSYRLAPRHPFPAAIADCCAALGWVAREVAAYGGDPTRLAFAGESAGANLVTSLALCTTFARPEPFARAAFDLGLVPRAVLPACGMLQVSDAGRFRRRKPRLSTFLHDRLAEVPDAYLAGLAPGAFELADPLLLLEGDEPSARPLPPFLAVCGTADPLLDDTRRLGAALGRRGVRADVHVYPGEIHAFHAMFFRAAARDAWERSFAFLGETLAPR